MAQILLRSRPLGLGRAPGLRPWRHPDFPYQRVIPGSQRWASETGENKTGHLQDGPNQAIFYFDNVYPLRLAWLFALPWGAEHRLEETLAKATSPHALRTNPLHILQNMPVYKSPNANGSGSKAASTTEEHSRASTEQTMRVETPEVFPRLKEGGAFVKITIPQGESPEHLESGLVKHLRDETFRPWWNPWGRMRARLVKGKPWVEDLYRMPSSRLKVQFLPASSDAPAAELTQEALYEYFRPYGKLAEITQQPYDSKEVPKYALLDFTSVRRAAMAKNCLHGVLVDEKHGGGKAGTLLNIGYQPKLKNHWIKDWIFGHPRIVIPILAAIIAAVTVAIFDPIRTFFIKSHITHLFRFEGWFGTRVRKLISTTTNLFTRRKREDDPGLDVIYDDRRGLIDQIQTWLMESSDTFIIVQGPRGSGKKELVVEEALKHRTKLVIDCKPIQEARGDSPTICAAAAQVGYFPVFSSFNSISGWIDLAAQGTTGVKTGFSETLDSQLDKILNNTAAALKEIAMHDRKKTDKDASLGDDEYLEAHPERRVVVVIDNFLHKSQESNSVYDKIADWAAGLTSANLAHVIFLTHDVSWGKSLSKALPNRVFRSITLSDSTPEAAKRFVISRLDADAEILDDPDYPEKKLTPSMRRKDLAELDQVIPIVGGRLTDLEFLARRIKAGESPHKAVEEIVDQSASEILKMYLQSPDESDSGKRRWTPMQAWLLVKQLAASNDAALRYNEIVLDDTFKSPSTAGPDQVLQALEQAELINISTSVNGRPQSVKPGKPVYHAAFQRLVSDKVLSSRLELMILADLIKVETGTIDKCEAELKMLAELPKQPVELAPRIKYLLGKVAASQANVEKYEIQQGVLKTTLKQEF